MAGYEAVRGRKKGEGRGGEGKEEVRGDGRRAVGEGGGHNRREDRCKGGDKERDFGK